MAFTLDGKYLVSTAKDERIYKVWNCLTGKEKARVLDPGPSSDVPLLTILPGGRQVVAWVAPSLLEFYDLHTGKLADSWNVDDDLKSVGCLAFSLDGSTAAVGASDGKVRLWDLAKKKQMLEGGDLQAYDDKVADLTLSANHKFLATTDEQGLLKIWDVAKCKEVQTLKAFTDPNQRAAAFVLNAEGTRLATAGLDSVVRLWSVADGKELRQWNFAASGQPGKAFVRTLAFTPDGKRIVTGNANTTLYLLECP